jgi:trans-2,3-dihydro-3-hydroxyanthranilate isomerase
MPELSFHLLNVFALESRPFTGNPLCVFENAEGLSDAQMLGLARQFNLSETTFILPPGSSAETARVRIFTPAFEMPFAGHPTLGTAHVVRMQSGIEPVILGMKAGRVEVTAAGDRWTLRAPKAPVTRPPDASRAELARALGLPEEALALDPLWVDTGAEQLVIPLISSEHVGAAHPDPELLRRHAFCASRGESMAYVWAPDADGTVVARYFFRERGSLAEDSATGSACANLGGWHLATGKPRPWDTQVRQGDAIGRPSLLHLRVDASKQIFVGGTVVETGHGAFSL